jgi:putative spermidine/putrescine transport system permease protein
MSAIAERVRRPGIPLGVVLGLVFVSNALTAITTAATIFATGAAQAPGGLAIVALILIVLLSLANCLFAAAAWDLRRWGVYGLAVASLLAAVIGLTLRLPAPYALLGLLLATLAILLLPASLKRRISTDLYNRPTLSLALLLTPPLFWLGLVYLGSLAALLVNSFYYLDGFTGQIVQRLTLRTYARLFTPANLDIIGRTVGMAAAVTLADAILAFPVAYYMARYARGRMRAFMYLAVLIPLWSSYLVRVYSWKLILAQEGIIHWVLTQARLDGALNTLLRLPVIGGTSLSVSPIGVWIVFVYVWLPYMILPIAAALERVPQSVIEASSDLGARPATTFWRVTLPLAFPGVVAGSIFSFSLTLGDFIIPNTLGNSSFFLGQAVLSHQGTSGNLPLAAAFTVVPIGVMLLYLMGARRMGAFDAL